MKWMAQVTVSGDTLVFLGFWLLSLLLLIEAFPSKLLCTELELDLTNSVQWHWQQP